MWGCHSDDNTAHNDLGNLRWDTPKSNGSDVIRNGHSCRGEKHGQVKLTSEQVASIIVEHSAGGVMQAQLAEKYKVSRALICMILKRRRWSYVDFTGKPPQG